MKKTPEKIQKSIETSMEKYRKRLVFNKEKQRIFKEGIKYIHEHELEDNILNLQIGGYSIALCYQINYTYEINSKMYKNIKWAYCIKSPIDVDCYKTVKSILGQRLNNRDYNYLELVNKYINKKPYIENIITTNFLHRVINPNYKFYNIPKKLHEYTTKHCIHCIM